MKMISKRNISGKIVIETESEKKRLFRRPKKITRIFEAQREFPKGYWEWLELPDKLIVPDVLSLQLDAWNRT